MEIRDHLRTYEQILIFGITNKINSKNKKVIKRVQVGISFIKKSIGMKNMEFLEQ